MDAALPLAIIFSFVYGLVWMKNRDTERRERHKLLEQALRAERLDPQLREQVIRALAPEQKERRAQQPSGSLPARGLRALFLAAGWVGLFVGGGMWMAGGRDYEEAGTIVFVVSLGLVTLPIAIRELELRRTA